MFLGIQDTQDTSFLRLCRTGEGDGLISAIDLSLDPVLVAVDDDDLELLVVQIKVGHLDAGWDKVFNFLGYLFIHPRIRPKQDKANPTYFGVLA